MREAWPMEEAYAAAAAALGRGWTALGRRAPQRIPLRLRGEDGLLLSALARTAGGEGEELARQLAETLSLEGTPFDRAQARNGLVLLFFSRRWLEQALECYAAYPWPELDGAIGLGRQDREDPDFLRAYTLGRCRRLTERGERREPLPVGLICLLAQGPGVRPSAWTAEIARRYWALPPEARRDARLSGAVGRAVGTF